MRMFENNDNDDPFDPCSDKYDIFLTLKFNNCFIVLIYIVAIKQLT